MISCLLKHEPDCANDRGWPRNTCLRCGKVRHAPDHFSKWKGDPQWCKAWPFWWEIGCWLTLTLAAVFIFKDGYVWMKRMLGLSPKCGCAKREKALDKLGASVASCIIPSQNPLPPSPVAPAA